MGLPAFHAHPEVWLVVAAVGAAYAGALRRRGREAPGAEAASRRQVRLFATGLVALALASTWPLHDLAEGYLFSAHMLQHLLYQLAAAPLLLAGTPPWLLRRLLAPRPVALLARLLSRPVVAIAVFNGLLLATHWPAVVELQVRSEPFHLAVHAALVGAGVVLWWPVLSPLPELPALSAPVQMLYLFFQFLGPTIPAAFLTFGRKPLYPVYALAPRVLGVSVMDDQLVAGLLMKIGGGLVVWGVILAIFFRWYRQETEEGWDALRWQSVEREIRTDLSRR